VLLMMGEGITRNM